MQTKSIKILVLEDEAQHLIRIKTNLLRFTTEYEVYTANSMDSAVAHVQAKPDMDVALLDINLGKDPVTERPFPNGIEAAEKIRAINPNIAIIFMTAYPEHYRNAQALIPDYWLTKPFKYNILDGIITTTLNSMDKRLLFEIEVPKITFKVLYYTSIDVKTSKEIKHGGGKRTILLSDILHITPEKTEKSSISIGDILPISIKKAKENKGNRVEITIRGEERKLIIAGTLTLFYNDYCTDYTPLVRIHRSHIFNFGSMNITITANGFIRSTELPKGISISPNIPFELIRKMEFDKNDTQTKQQIEEILMSKK
jgi:CheY-like chemotaxis protein